MTRAYRQKRRADSRAETRQRIVDAAIALHQTIGPAATTISDVAEKAQVGRVTVYRHFPDELSLSQACSGHYFATHPFPDPGGWASIADPEERLGAALADAWDYHRRTEAMISRVLRDARDHPVMAPYDAHWRRAAETLAAAFPSRSPSARRRLVASIALALSFDTWDMLVRRQRLPGSEALALMLGMVAAAATVR